MLTLMVALVIFAILIYTLQLIPLEPKARNIITLMLCLVLVVWLLQDFGLLGHRGVLR